MRGLTRCVFVALLGLGLVVFVGVRDARADVISGGELYGVFVDGGVFNGTGQGETYTVVRFLEFGPTGLFPNSLDPIAFGNPDPENPVAPIAPGSQFFMLGSLLGDGDPNHLLISLDGVEPGQLPPPIDLALHDNLIAGLAGLGQGFIDPAMSLTAEQFWGNFAPGVGEQFFNSNTNGGVDAVRNLAEGSYEFQTGSEDLFGYYPGEKHKHRHHHDDRCDDDCDKDWDDDCPDSDPADYFVGTLNGGVQGFTFTDPEGQVFDAVPEPSSLALFGCALGGLFLGVRQRRRRGAA